jgi:hypothetical protein
MAAASLLVQESTLVESPYPGLRSFRPEDSDYFFGREDQVADIVERLRMNRFVAVLGGSGSGKSSLVLAGAIPRLRSEAIQDAGDLWVPVVTTPGTNLRVGHTPLTRLADSFCAVLSDVPFPQERLRECMALLRKRNGFGLLVERFGRDLRNSSGLDLTSPKLQVNFLLLIDQFEELFHPSNMESAIAEDCTHLANRIVEQFKSQHAQVCVALTMRSEHLNDCPRYQNLPDAINSSGYLVKRLIGDALHRAIEEPAQRYLTKRRAALMSAQRQNRSSETTWNAAIPEEIPFSPEVRERLIRDSEAIFEQKDHADQLPLLQHTLFWIWRAACERTAGRATPDEITVADLCAAVLPEGACEDLLDGNVNTLESCLENRCESVFAAHGPEQARWERAFRSLAFKEPNSGNYTQQRLSMEELGASMALPGADLHAMKNSLAAWLAPHAYLHWDAPCRTVKVAHETLIRRWSRFRNWIDDEDALFRVYIRLLEDCARWVEMGGEELSTGVALRRYEDVSMLTAVRDRARVSRLERLLVMDRDGKKFAAIKSRAPEFLEKSKQLDAKQKAEREHAEQARRDAEVTKARALAEVAEAEAQAADARAQAAEADATRRTQEERAKRQNLKFLVLSPLLLVVAVGLAFQYVRSKVLTSDHVMNVSYRISAETDQRLNNQSNGFDEQNSPLRNVLTGAKIFLDERTNVWNISSAWLSRLLSRDVGSMTLSSQLAEQRTITGLRSVLQGAAWAVAPSSDFVDGSAVACDRVDMNEDEFLFVRSETPDSYRFFAHPSRPGEGLIVLDSWRTIFAGRDLDADSGNTVCRIDNQLISAPSTERVAIGIAADLSHIVLVLANYIQVHSVLWNTQSVGVRAGPTVVTHSDMSNLNLKQAVTLPVANRYFARDLRFSGSTTMRVFNVEPSRFQDDKALSGMPFADLSSGGLCEQLAQKQSPATRSNMLWQGEIGASEGQPRTYCLQVSRVPGESSQAPEFVATLYKFAGAKRIDDALTLPILDQSGLGPKQPIAFRLHGDDGWLAFQRDESGWLAVPWGLNAFVDLGVAVFEPEKLEHLKEGRFERVYEEVLDPEHQQVKPVQLKQALVKLRGRSL